VLSPLGAVVGHLALDRSRAGCFGGGGVAGARARSLRVAPGVVTAQRRHLPLGASHRVVPADKRGLGRIDVDTRELIREVGQAEGFRMLEIRPTHVLTLGELPLLHGDPFSRMLIAQAIRDRLTLVTRDEAMRRYEVDVAW
jgi:hypothetical protein